MSRIAATSTTPYIQGFRFDHDATIIENATAAWNAQKTIMRTQYEKNARVLARHVFRNDDLEFAYHDELFPETPTFEIGDELIAYRPDHSCFALIEICPGCQQVWNWNDFTSLAGLGKQLALVDARDPFTCHLCKAYAEVAKQQEKKK